MDNDGRALAEFGLRIRSTRSVGGLSQEELAHRAGLHRTYVSSVERGERNIRLLSILTLATVLGVDPGSLVTGMTRPPAEETSK